MKVKGFQLWHLWQVLTLEDIFSYFTMENVLYAIFVKNTSLCMHIFLFHERDKSIKHDVCERLIFKDIFSCIMKVTSLSNVIFVENVDIIWHIFSFHTGTSLSDVIIVKNVSFEDICLYYKTGASLSVVMFVDNISLWRHILQLHKRKKIFQMWTLWKKLALDALFSCFIKKTRLTSWCLWKMLALQFSCIFCHFLTKQVLGCGIHEKYQLFHTYFLISYWNKSIRSDICGKC